VDPVFGEAGHRKVIRDQVFDAQFDRHVEVVIQVVDAGAEMLGGAKICRHAAGEVGTEIAQKIELGLQHTLQSDIGEVFGSELARTVGDVPEAADQTTAQPFQRVVFGVEAEVGHGVVAVGAFVALAADGHGDAGGSGEGVGGVGARERGRAEHDDSKKACLHDGTAF